jgi:hypothetical protein
VRVSYPQGRSHSIEHLSNIQVAPLAYSGAREHPSSGDGEG